MSARVQLGRWSVVRFLPLVVVPHRRVRNLVMPLAVIQMGVWVVSSSTRHRTPSKSHHIKVCEWVIKRYKRLTNNVTVCYLEHVRNVAPFPRVPVGSSSTPDSARLGKPVSSSSRITSADEAV